MNSAQLWQCCFIGLGVWAGTGSFWCGFAAWLFCDLLIGEIRRKK